MTGGPTLRGWIGASHLHGGARGDKKQSLGFILWGPELFVQSFMEMSSIAVKKKKI